MIYMFWNVRGLGKSYRRSLVKNHIIQESADVVALQETIKQGFDDHELKEMAGNQDYLWRWSPAKGHLGGLLIGVKIDSFEIEQVEDASFFLGVLLRNRTTNHRFWLLNAYGPAQHEFS